MQRLEPLGREEDETEQAQEGGANGQRADDGAHPEHAIPCEPLQQDAADDRAERYAHPGCADPQSDGQPRIGDPSNNPMMDDSVAPIKLCINITYL